MHPYFQACTLGSLQSDGQMEEARAERYDGFCGGFEKGCGEGAVGILAADIHVRIQFRGVDLGGAIEADERRRYGAIADGGGWSRGGDVLEDALDEGGVVRVFEEGGEGGAGAWGGEVAEGGLQVKD